MYSQNGISFTQLYLTNENLSKEFKKYQILKIIDNTQLLTDGAEFQIDYLNKYNFILKENRFFDNDLKIAIKSENDVEYKKIDELGFDGKYFLNANGAIDNQIAMSLFQNQYTIHIKNKEKEFYIEPLLKYDKSASSDNYVYYETIDILNPEVGECPVKENSVTDLEDITNYRFEPSENCKTVELNFCVDYSMYITFNSINEVINRTLEILNLTQLDYSIANGLAYDVNFKVKRYYMITCLNCNYWPSTGDITTNFNNFTNFSYYSNMFDYASDIRVFWQNEFTVWGGTINGIGTQPSNGICIDDPLITVRQSALKNYPTATNSTRKTLSHEIGHNFSSGHISPSDNIMAACCYFGNAWNPSTISLINHRLQNSNCFIDCSADSCNNKKVENLVLNIDFLNKVINASWQAEEDIQYKTRLFNFTTNTWSEYTMLNSSINSIAYNYNTDSTSCSDKYKFEIVPVCSDFNGFSQILLFTVPVEETPNIYFESTAQDEVLCSEQEYTFSVNASYPGTNPIYQWKINDNNVGTNSPIFTTSSLQNNDVLSCEITSNEACLSSSTEEITKVVTVVPLPCENLSAPEFELNAIDFFPNPVKNYFTIKANSEILNVVIYNTLGQKIIERMINQTQTDLDLSTLSNAIYFVKIELENKTKTVKILVEK